MANGFESGYQSDTSAASSAALSQSSGSDTNPWSAPYDNPSGGPAGRASYGQVAPGFGQGQTSNPSESTSNNPNPVAPTYPQQDRPAYAAPNTASPTEMPTQAPNGNTSSGPQWSPKATTNWNAPGPAQTPIQESSPAQNGKTNGTNFFDPNINYPGMAYQDGFPGNVVIGGVSAVAARGPIGKAVSKAGWYQSRFGTTDTPGVTQNQIIAEVFQRHDQNFQKLVADDEAKLTSLTNVPANQQELDRLLARKEWLGSTAWESPATGAPKLSELETRNSAVGIFTEEEMAVIRARQAAHASLPVENVNRNSRLTNILGEDAGGTFAKGAATIAPPMPVAIAAPSTCASCNDADAAPS